MIWDRVSNKRVTIVTGDLNSVLFSRIKLLNTGGVADVTLVVTLPVQMHKRKSDKAMTDKFDEPFRLRDATPADLPQLEAWCLGYRPGDAPPFIAVTLSEFVAASSRGFLLIIIDGPVERGFVVVSRLWSNRLRGETAVIDDFIVDDKTDLDLLRHEVKRFVKVRGIGDLLSRGDDGALVSI